MLATAGLVVVALVLVSSAVAVVVSDNLVHSVFWLAVMLLATAVVYIFLDASFLAAIQVLLYTGGVITMMLFGVMLTHRDPGKQVPSAAEARNWAAPVAIVTGFMLISAIWTTPELADLAVTPSGTAQQVGRMFLDRYLIAFEALSVLLLAGMIGAIVLARKVDA